LQSNARIFLDRRNCLSNEFRKYEIGRIADNDQPHSELASWLSKYTSRLAQI